MQLVPTSSQTKSTNNFADQVDEQLSLGAIGLESTTPTGQVDDGIGQQNRVLTELADPGVAPEAQQPANDSRLMVMIDVQRSTGLWHPPAQGAATTLVGQHRLVLVTGQTEHAA